MNNIIEKCKKTRILGVIGIAGLILGTILPYVKYRLFGHKLSISLWGYWQGKIVMILAIANLLFIFRDIVEKYIPTLFDTQLGQKIQELDNTKYSLFPTILSAFFALYLTFELHADFKHYNLGFYSLWVGTICLIAYSFLHRNRE